MNEIVIFADPVFGDKESPGRGVGGPTGYREVLTANRLLHRSATGTARKACLVRARLHQTSASMRHERCNDTNATALITDHVCRTKEGMFSQVFVCPQWGRAWHPIHPWAR